MIDLHPKDLEKFFLASIILSAFGVILIATAAVMMLDHKTDLQGFFGGINYEHQEDIQYHQAHEENIHYISDHEDYSLYIAQGDPIAGTEETFMAIITKNMEEVEALDLSILADPDQSTLISDLQEYNHIIHIAIEKNENENMYERLAIVEFFEDRDHKEIDHDFSCSPEISYCDAETHKTS